MADYTDDLDDNDETTDIPEESTYGSSSSHDDELAALGAVTPEEYTKSLGTSTSSSASSKSSDNNDELRSLGAVTPEEHDTLSNYVNTPEQESMKRSAINGATQGATFGFGDELGGLEGAGFEAGANLIGQGPNTGQSLIDLYKQYRDLARERNAKSKAQNPGSYLAGELTGGLILPLGEAGAMKDATMAAKMLKGAKMGTGMGAATALGTSEKQMSDPTLAKDLVEGAGMGGLTGAAIPPAIGTIKGAANAVGDTGSWLANKVFGPVGAAAKMGYEGTNVTIPQGQQAIRSELTNFANSVAPSLQDKLNNLGTIKNQMISDAADAGVKIDSEKVDKMISDILGNDVESNLPQARRELERLKEIVRTAKEGRIIGRGESGPLREGQKDLTNPEEQYQLYKDLKEQSKFGDQSFKSDEVLRKTGQAAKDSRDLIREAIPGLEQVDDRISGYKNATDALGLKDTYDIDESKIREKIMSLLSQEGSNGIGGIKAQATIDDFLNELKKVNPDMAERLSKQFPELGSKLDVLQDVTKKAHSIANISRSVGTGAANIGGFYTGKAVNAIKNVGETGVAAVGNMTPEWIKQKLSQLALQDKSPAAQSLRNVLIKAADSDDRARNAIMFGLMQNPGYRQMLTNDEDKAQ